MTAKDDEIELSRALNIALQHFSRSSFFSKEKLELITFDDIIGGDVEQISARITATASEMEESLEATRAEFRNSLRIIGKNFAHDGSILDQNLDGLLKFAYAVGVLEGRFSALKPAREIKAIMDAGDVAKRKRNRAKATETAAKNKSGPTIDAALDDLKSNPQTTQGKCAARVAEKLGKTDVDAVSRTIAKLFERRYVQGRFRDKRPKPEYISR